MSNQETEKFDRDKIYEKLEYNPQPENYSGNVPWIVQQQISETSGKHYLDRVGKLKEYPQFKLPVENVESGLMLDIGNGWGRWLVAGANQGYIPIGIDIRLEFCETALQTLKAHNKSGYSVVADLKEIPFKSSVFDLVWSFSVIQHTHKDRLIECLTHINRILTKKGFAFLEFPNKNGLKNRFQNVKNSELEKNDYNSWCVRYYTIEEYKEIFKKIFNNFLFKNHSFLGIGVLPEDLKYVSLKNKVLSGISLLGSFFTKMIPQLKNISDSVYIKVQKNNKTFDEEKNIALSLFIIAHKLNPTDNLNIVHLLRCPLSGGDLLLSDDKKKLISQKGGVTYPIINNIPILIKSEASSI